MENFTKSKPIDKSEMATKTQKEITIKLSEESLLILKNFHINKWLERNVYGDAKRQLNVDPNLTITLDEFIRLSAGAFRLPSYDHWGDINLEWKE